MGSPRALLGLSFLAHVALVAHGAPAAASTLDVGAGQPYATIGAAAAAAAAGDTIAIHAGTYHEAVTFGADNLTVTGVGARPVVDMTGMAISNGKAIFVASGTNFTLTNVELVGASVGDGNGAGLRWEGPGALVVRDCVFRSNEDGILTAAAGTSADIETSEFVDNSHGSPGLTHSVYIGEIQSVLFRGNWSHALYGGGSDVGHLFKSRAALNVVIGNRLTAEDMPSSYEVNLPEGGEAYVIGNLIQQRVGGQRIVISFGDGDGTQRTGSALYVVNNTIVSESAGDATFVRTTQADAQITVANNLIVGPGALVSGGVIAQMANNVQTTAPGLVDQAGFDYHLAPGSPAIDAGAPLAPTATRSLTPEVEYVHPASVEARGTSGTAIDVGAYEFNNQPGAGGGDNQIGDLIDAGTGGAAAKSGCGCTTSGGAPGAGLLTLGVAACLRRRQKSVSPTSK